MPKEKSLIRRLLLRTSIAAGLLAIFYAWVVVRPDPSQPARREHRERGRKLGLVKDEREEKPAPIPAPLPPPQVIDHTKQASRPIWESPEQDPWIMWKLGVRPSIFDAQVTYTFANRADEAIGWRAARARALYAAQVYGRYWRMEPPPEAADLSRAGALDCNRVAVEPMMEQLAESALRTDGLKFEDDFLSAMPSVIAYLSLHGDRDRALKLTETYMAQNLANPWFFNLFAETMFWPRGKADLALLTSPAFNPIACAALELDAAGTDLALLDRIAEMLEHDVPTREKLDWMAEQQLYEKFGAGDERHGAKVYETTENPFHYFADGVPEYILNTVQQPLLRAQYRDFFGAYLRGDIPAAMDARRNYAATADRMNLRHSAITDDFHLPEDESAVTLCRYCDGAPNGYTRVEMARFVVASLRFRRAENRWPTGLDELVPTWLPAGSVGADGARWGVTELPSFISPTPATRGVVDAFPRLLNYLTQVEEPPSSMEDLGVPSTVESEVSPARPAFWRIGPADPCGVYFTQRLSPQYDGPSVESEAERLALAKNLVAGKMPMQEIRIYTITQVADPVVLRLLRPRGS